MGCGVGMDRDAGRGFRGVLGGAGWGGGGHSLSLVWGDGGEGVGGAGWGRGGAGGHSLSLVWGDGGEGVGGAGWGGVTHCRWSGVMGVRVREVLAGGGGVTHCRWLRSSSIVFVPAMKTRSLQFCHCDFVDRM